MAEVYDTSQKIWTRFLEAQNEQGAPTNLDPLNTMPAWVELTRTMLDHPQDMAAETLRYWEAQGKLWQAATLRWLGAPDATMPELPHMAAAGKRFAHKEWSENALFDYLKQSYLLTSGWINHTVHTVGEMHPRDRKKAEFYTRNFVEAMNPANFFALNPEVMEATLEQKGENLVRGLHMMLEDLERGKGQLLIRQTDMDAFEVGRDMAVTPGKVIWQNDILQLIQYAPATDKVHSIPLLIVPPWINKFYVLDLNDKKSMVKWLVAQGYTVFMVSWVNPTEKQKNETWDSYLTKGTIAAMDKVLEETGVSKLHLAGYCIGGTLVGTLMAYLSKRKDTRVASTTFFTAQLDFADAGELQVFVDDHTIKAVDEEMEKGYLPAQKMASAFNMLRSNDLIWSYVVNNYMLGKDPFPFDLLYWNADSTAMPAKVHHFYLENFYDENTFAHGDLSVLDTPITLADIKGPVYHVATREDHIAPAASVYAGARQMEKAKVRFVLSGSGHIAGVVNPPAAGKYQFWTAPDLSPVSLQDWMETAEETPGSWWTDWDEWLSERSGRMVNARTPGAKLGTLEEAPGAYVKVRFDKQ
ncbi:class I poly(R)-hydroxyalkanoic acid synthase [Algicella marina]|uniref:Class I poly(R)-hydroxyalkanoic acid synthase n=2 Tax=Algicella marina TaxID=2683284 RepID=A0A6P1T3Q6_9RHOB|nr:class I poly(R)-hydroxyalkanoic acid synthase [Algicella marina]